jgi:hypothetical protein
MGKGSNPYAGQYAPSKLGVGSKEFKKTLKGLKVKAPNKHMSETGYKKGLKKVAPESKGE